MPYGLTIYLDGLMDSRVSACCEYRHQCGMLLGSKTAHFKLVKVEGGTPCYRLVYALDVRANNYKWFTENNMCNNYEVIVVIILLFCRCEIEMNKKYLKEKQDREIEMVLGETSSMQVCPFIKFGNSMVSHNLSSYCLDPVANSIRNNYDSMHVCSTPFT